jgi:hypothetical protein
MQDKRSEFLDETKRANRATFDAVQKLAETHFKLLQNLADVQREQFDRALEAAREQLQLVCQAKDPREFASAQANLLQNYGQRYVQSVNEALTLMSGAWQEYQDQFKKSMSTAADTIGKTAETATRGAQGAAGGAAQSTKTTASKKPN